MYCLFSSFIYLQDFHLSESSLNFQSPPHYGCETLWFVMSMCSQMGSKKQNSNSYLQTACAFLKKSNSECRITILLKLWSVQTVHCRNTKLPIHIYYLLCVISHLPGHLVHFDKLRVFKIF